MIYGVASADSTLTAPAWTIEAAMEALDKAIEEDNPVSYTHLGMNDVISYIKRCRDDERPEETMSDEGRQESDSEEIKLNIEF